jgi:hypothetical protein
MTLDFAASCLLVRPGRPRYPVLVHRAAVSLRASFRPRLTTTPLRFANPSPPSGWIEDFHLQAVVHARHTRKAPPVGAGQGFGRKLINGASMRPAPRAVNRWHVVAAGLPRNECVDHIIADGGVKAHCWPPAWWRASYHRPSARPLEWRFLCRPSTISKTAHGAPLID